MGPLALLIDSESSNFLAPLGFLQFSRDDRVTCEFGASMANLRALRISFAHWVAYLPWDPRSFFETIHRKLNWRSSNFVFTSLTLTNE
jgi:hypothetical protein